MENKKHLIYKEDLIAEYDRVHIGPPGGARKLIEDAPTVDAVEVVHGRWKDDHGDYVCSVCHAAYSDEVVYMNKDCQWEELRYCPNCGSKMDGDNNG